MRDHLASVGTPRGSAVADCTGRIYTSPWASAGDRIQLLLTVDSASEVADGQEEDVEGGAGPALAEPGGALLRPERLEPFPSL